MARHETVPFAENNAQRLLCLAETSGGYHAPSSAKPDTGVARAESGFSGEQDTEPADESVGLCHRSLARRLMQECGLVSSQPGKHRYRGMKEASPASPDLLKRRFTPSEPNKVWSGDISYIRVNSGWVYLALVTDLYFRRIVGSAISLSPDAERVCRAMRNALETRVLWGRLLFHSDQGGPVQKQKIPAVTVAVWCDAEYEPEGKLPG